jgi:hypothetical protein
MGDADDAGGLPCIGPLGPDLVGQPGDLAHGAQRQESLGRLQRESGGIIAAIFETTKSAQEDGGGRGATDIADDAAHVQERMSLSTMAPGSVEVLGAELAPRIEGGVDAGMDAVSHDGASLRRPVSIMRPATGLRWVPPSCRRLDVMVPAPKFTFSPRIESPR